MATVCINCGKKIGAFAIESPFELCNGQLLCAKCAGTLRRDIKNLYDSSNEEAFLAAKKDILEKSKPIYNNVAIMAIAQRIDQIYEKTLYPKFYPEAAAEEKANNEKIKLEASLNAIKLAANQQLTTGYDFNGSENTQVKITLPTMTTDFTDANLLVYSKNDSVSDLRVISQSAYNALDKASIANGTVYLVYE